MSSIASARSFFSFPFWPSSVRSRCASETVTPPNFAVYLKKVPDESPYFRQRSAVATTASCSRSIPMICSCASCILSVEDSVIS